MPTGFNSRTLGRVRRLGESILILTDKFQFTHPGKGATEVFHTLTVKD